jgi:hypothetical protein
MIPFQVFIITGVSIGISIRFVLGSLVLVLVLVLIAILVSVLLLVLVFAFGISISIRNRIMRMIVMMISGFCICITTIFALNVALNDLITRLEWSLITIPTFFFAIINAPL